jgi:hypothetical protein
MSIHHLVLDALVPLLSAAFFSFFFALDGFCNKLASASEVTKNKTLHKSRDKNVVFSHSAIPSDHS